MKDKINRILTKHIHAQCHAEINLHTVQGIISATDELTALMCYREVKAIIEWIGIDYLTTYEESIVESLNKSYHSDMIWEAIEQFKNEQNGR